MYHFYGALLVSHVPVRVTRGALVAHRYTYTPSLCRTLPYRMPFINDLADPVFDGIGLADLKSRASASY